MPPILKLKIGGTLAEEEKRDAAWRIVPSPPNVVVRSILEDILEGSAAAEEGADDEEERVRVCNSKGRSFAKSSATSLSTTMHRLGYVLWTCFANSSSAAVAGGELSFLTRRMFRGGWGQRRESRLWAGVSESIRTA